MTALTLLLVASSLPAAFVITAAHRAGARSWRGRYVWLLEECAERMIRHARGVREFSEWRERRKA